MDKKIAVAGTGYVGLSNAILLAQHNRVTAVDLVAEKVRMINRGESPLKDREIEEYLKSGKLDLTATTDGDGAYREADYVIVSTPTDYDPERGSFDTSSVEGVIRRVRELNPAAYIVVKSTVPIGFVKSMQEKFGTDHILFSPEFLREGQALRDNLHPFRIIVGADRESAEAMEKAEEFAALLKEGATEEHIPVLLMAPTEAEAVKLFANTYLAMRVAYFNELDMYAEANGLEAEPIIRGVCCDMRIGNGYNNPSFGYGGYCLPKDTKQMLANYAGVPQALIGAVVSSNEKRKRFIADRVLERLGPAEGERKNRAGIYLLAMKAGSDNARQSAVLDIIRMLRDGGTEVWIYDPALKGKSFPGCRVTEDLEEFKRESDVILANRKAAELEDVAEKLYTRDIFLAD